MYGKKIFSNIGFFHCLFFFFFFFRSCDALIATKITSACNIWETKQTQEKYGRGGRSIKTGNVERRVKDVKTKAGWAGSEGGGQERGLEFIGQHEFLGSLQRIAG